MPWNIFRSKTGVSRRESPETSRSGSASLAASAKEEASSRSRRRARATRDSAPSSSSTRAVNALLVSERRRAIAQANAPTLPHPGLESPAKPTHRRGRSMLDPESDPLGGLDGIAQLGQYVPSSREHRRSHSASRRISSVHSVRSTRSGRSGQSVRSGFSSSRSTRSGSVTTRNKGSQSSRMAQHAMAAFIASNGGRPLHCYTCENEFTGLRCDRCQTAYLPPGFVFSAAAALNGGAAMASATPTAASATAPSVSPENASSTISLSGISLSGATSYVGVVPDLGDDFESQRTIDFDLVADLAACNDYGLLEAVIFDYFSSIDTVVNTFCTKDALKASESHGSSPSSARRTTRNYGFDETPSATESRNSISYENDSLCVVDQESQSVPSQKPPRPELGAESWLDAIAVNHMYNTLASVSSTGPMRGILQGAEAVLLTRKHAPVSEKEILYICVILQCPAIVECSMFTKITGPMQKLARYSSLRSRARMLLEVLSGLVVHCDEALHPILVNHLVDIEPTQFANLLDLCNAYISHRLLFHFQYKTAPKSRPSRFQQVRHDWYADDWRIIVVVKFLSLLWAANEILRAKKAGLSISTFYNTMVDQIALRDDYDFWQITRTRKKPRFCFCRYSFLLSAGSKAKILEHGIKREVNSAYQRELFALMADPNRSVSLEAEQSQLAALRTLILRVRRSHLLDDSVKQLRNWHVSKRRELRVEFFGEQGVDAGGLKREWCLMFYRKLLDPELGAFVLDETSNYSWFGTYPDLDVYRTAGIILGLALFNSITIDINLPLLLFKVLLDRPYDLDDVATLWPEIAQSLQSILDFDDERFEETFGLTFVAPDGTPLMPDGELRPVTSDTRETYVQLLVEHLVDQKGSRVELKAFKQSFLDVCGCNAITLFQPEELELLIRGDRKPMDVLALRSVTKYVNFGHRFERANQEPVVQWFWDYFQSLDPQGQAKLMRFVTATDRVPASGMVNMRFSIMCLGPDCERLPIAHTCFNQLCLYKYKTRRKLERKLGLAVAECQGFGLK